MKPTVGAVILFCLLFAINASAERQPSKPIVCGGQKDLTIKNKVIKTAKTAVIVKGSCDLTLINCRIVGNVGLRVSTSGDVYVRKSYVEGTKAAVIVTGAGDVHAFNSTFVGRIKKGGAGDFNDKGGNTIKKKKGKKK